MTPLLRKRLGQHHLVNPEVCRPLIEFLRPLDTTVIEIGPGGGVLTGELLNAGARVWGWELDAAWAFDLHARRKRSSLSLVVGDALKLGWDRIASGTMVAGNLPYQVSTVVIEKLLFEALAVRRAGFLVQAEVAERLVAVPSTRAYGAFSVVVSAFADCSLLSRVRAGSFRPVPKVAGAFVGLSRKEPPLPMAQAERFVETVRDAFRHRRKTVRNGLGAVWGRGAARHCLEAAGIAPDRRAETLSVDAYLALHAARLHEKC